MEYADVKDSRLKTLISKEYSKHPKQRSAMAIDALQVEVDRRITVHGNAGQWSKYEDYLYEMKENTILEDRAPNALDNQLSMLSNMMGKLMTMQAEIITLMQPKKGGTTEENKDDDHEDESHTSPEGSSPLKEAARPKFKPLEHIPPFDGDYGQWHCFKTIVEQEVVEGIGISDTIKANIILNLLKEDPKLTWENSIAQKKSLKDAWKELVDIYEDPQKLDSYLEKLISVMPRVKNDEDEPNLKIIAVQVKKLRNMVTNLGPERLAQARGICKDIANKFWLSEAKKMKTRVKTLDELVSRIDRLYEDSVVFNNSIGEKPKNSEAKGNRKGTAQCSTVQVNRLCQFCGQSHFTQECDAKLSYQQKRDLVKEKMLCQNCLRYGHVARECLKKVTCQTCNEKHATAIHGVRFNFADQPLGQDSRVPPVNNPVVTTPPQFNQFRPPHPNHQLGPRGPPPASYPPPSNNSRPIMAVNTPDASFAFQARCNGQLVSVLLDTGASISIVSKDIVPKSSRSRVEEFPVHGFGNGMVSTIREKANIEIEHPEGSILLDAFVCDLLKAKSIIIGRNDLHKCLKDGTHIWKTHWGDYDFANLCRTSTGCSIQVVDPLETSDEDAEVEIEMKKLENGRYEVKLPFFSKARPKNNYNQAVKKLDRLINRLKKEGTYDDYQAQLMEYVEKGHAEEVFTTDGHFIGHREVERPEALTTKFRVVLTPLEINELLWKGESVGLDVLNHLLRSRCSQFLLTADMQKAFLQIMIAEPDRKFLRFLWKTDDRVRTFQMKVLPFGIVSSPAILLQAVKSTIDDMSPSARMILNKTNFMDDFLIGAESAEELISVTQEAVKIFKQAGFLLHKLHSNIECDLLDISQEPSKLLGVKWNPAQDVFQVLLPKPMNVSTKRQLLSIIGKIYDPFGLYEPVKLALRILYSKVLNVEWDDPIPDNIATEANNVFDLMLKTPALTIPRKLKQGGILRGFCDSSLDGYGYVIYLNDHFVFGKSKVAPRKITTIKRPDDSKIEVKDRRTIVDLELLSLYELCKALPRLLVNLPLFDSIQIFTDSLINVERLHSSPNRFPISIARRLLTILKIGAELNATFHHIKGTNNPADFFSRPSDVASAPQWVTPDMSKIVLAATNAVATKVICSIEIRQDHSVMKVWLNRRSLVQLCSIVQKLKAALNRARKRLSPNSADTTHSDIESVISLYQHCEEHIPNDCQLTNGLYCWKNRNLSFPAHWIPKDSNLAQELLWNAHKSAMHRGVDTSLSHLLPSFWIPNANRSMRKIISRCFKCRRMRSKPICQPFGPLHESQLKPVQGFENIMMDCFGPLELANGAKFHGLIIVCRTSRAIKLCILEKEDAATLLNALEAVWSTVGYPLKIWSDNGSNFLAVKNKLDKLHQNGRISQIRWSTSTPLSPWMNGGAERMIRLVKDCYSTLFRKERSFLALSRVFAKIEKVVNSRPVLQKDGRAISAFEIAFGRKNMLGGPSDAENPEKLFEAREREFREISALWIQQYLKKISRYNENTATNIQVGDVVLVPNLMQKKVNWPVARIVEVFPGSDGLIRSVRIKINDQELLRPVNRVIPIGGAGC